MKKLLLATGFLAIATAAATWAATSTAWAQAYGYWGMPYGYGIGTYITVAPMRRRPMPRLRLSTATTPMEPSITGIITGSTDRGEVTTWSRPDSDRVVRR